MYFPFNPVGRVLVRAWPGPEEPVETPEVAPEPVEELPKVNRGIGWELLHDPSLPVAIL